MKLFKNLPIQRKMLLTNLVISGAVVLVATAALLVFQVLNFRTNFKRDIATLAAVIANNSTAAVAFNDANGAAEVVNSLKANPAVVGACLIRTDGSVLAAMNARLRVTKRCGVQSSGYQYGGVLCRAGAGELHLQTDSELCPRRNQLQQRSAGKV